MGETDISQDKYLDQHLIGGREEIRILIVDYDPAWPERFQYEHERIANVLGSVAKSIEHIGSTSVPGLAAKPIIDILVTVDDVENDERFIPAFESIGLHLRVREPEHRMFRPTSKEVHVHVWQHDCSEAQKYITLRDWLRTNNADRELYERTKRNLANRQWRDMNYYADAKSPVIAAIMERASPAVL